MLETIKCMYILIPLLHVYNALVKLIPPPPLPGKSWGLDLKLPPYTYRGLICIIPT